MIYKNIFCRTIGNLVLLLLSSTYIAVAQDASPDIDYKWFREAMLQRSKGNDQQAVKDFGLFITRYPTQHPSAYYYRGHAYMHLGDLKHALADFKKLEKLEPNNIDGPFSIGKLYYSTNEYKKSITYFDKVLQINPFHAPSLNDSGMAKMFLLDFDSAFRLFLRATEVDSTFAMAFNNAGAAIYFNQDIDKPVEKDLRLAIHFFSKAIAIYPKFPLALRNRAIMHILLHEHAAALTDLEQAQQHQPNEAMIPFYKGVLAAEKDDHSLAFQEFEKALALNPNVFIAHEEVANLHKKQNNFEQAINSYKKAQSISNFKIYKGLMDYKIALTYALTGDSAKMYDALENALKKDVFNDYRVYQDLLSAKELKQFRNQKRLYHLVERATKGKKENRFARPELQWFRMRR